MSPLQKAIHQKNLSEVRTILGTDPSLIHETSDDGIPLALYAAQYGSFEILKFIVEYSMASLDLYDSMHRNLLHYATLSGDIQKCRYLLERGGCSPLEADQTLMTPYEISYRKEEDALYRYYLSVVGTPFPMMYQTPIRRGFFPDPSIVRVGDDYYMVNSSFIFFPCIPISHSKDLVHWTIIGHAITNPEWSELGTLEGGRGYWAPDISYDQGRFYITATYRYNDTGKVRRRQMVVSSEHPEGPYSRPVFIAEDGIDPSVFHEDGRHYMLLNRGARIFELNEDCTEKISEAELLFYGAMKHAPEGPHLLKKDGYYYLFLAEGGTGPGHRITVARSRTLKGIYEPCPYNPIMRQNDPHAPIQRCGHGKPVMTEDGRWYMVYLCGRYLEGKYTMLGRETALDEITWTEDGWPIVNGLQGPSALAPLPFAGEEDGIPENDSSIRPREWMTPREPQKDAVISKEDGIHLLSSPAGLHSTDSRNLYLHRQESFTFRAMLTLRLPKLKPGQSAGVICYYDENSYAFFALNGEEHGVSLTLSEQIGNNAIKHECMFFEEQEEICRFLIETDGLTRTFSLSAEDRTLLSRKTLENVTYLSDEGIQMGKRFTGAAFGTAACGSPQFSYTLLSADIRTA